MKEFFALLIARNKEFYRDRATLGWNFVFPFIVIVGFAYGYQGSSQAMFKTGMITEANPAVPASEAADSFRKTPSVQFVPVDDLEKAIQKVRMHQLDLVISTGPRLKYWVNPLSPKGQVVEKLLLASAHSPDVFQKESAPGREIRYVEWLIPGILAMNMMFSSLFGVGYTIVRYRKNGVLKRFKATPVTAFQFLAAQLVSRLLLIMFTSTVVFLGAIRLIHFDMQGSYLDLFCFFAIGATCMISVGLIFASRISSEELAEGLLNLLTWPMMFLSGVWFSLEGATPIVVEFSKIFPLTHIVSGARAIMLEGASLGSLLPQVTILGVMAVIFITIGSVFFKWN